MKINKAALYLPGGVGVPGFLSIDTATGTITFRLSARQTALVVQLVLTRQRQVSWPPECTGWMSARLIGEVIGGGPKDYVVSPDSIRKYIGRIRKKVRQHLGAPYAKFDPFERLPLLGYRLSMMVELFGPEPMAA